MAEDSTPYDCDQLGCKSATIAALPVRKHLPLADTYHPDTSLRDDARAFEYQSAWSSRLPALKAIADVTPHQ